MCEIRTRCYKINITYGGTRDKVDRDVTKKRRSDTIRRPHGQKHCHGPPPHTHIVHHVSGVQAYSYKSVPMGHYNYYISNGRYSMLFVNTVDASCFN